MDTEAAISCINERAVAGPHVKEIADSRAQGNKVHVFYHVHVPAANVKSVYANLPQELALLL